MGFAGRVEIWHHEFAGRLANQLLNFRDEAVVVDGGEQDAGICGKILWAARSLVSRVSVDIWADIEIAIAQVHFVDAQCK